MEKFPHAPLAATARSWESSAVSTSFWDLTRASLGATTGAAMQSLLRELNRHNGITVLHVTPNQADANAPADRCLHSTMEPESRQVVIQA